MVRIQFRAIWVAMMTFALSFSPGAKAASRFETGESPSPVVRAALDFTIIIPEFIRLGSSSASRPDDAGPILLARSESARTNPFAVLGNAGTILVTSAQPDLDDHLPAIASNIPPPLAYAVALP